MRSVGHMRLCAVAAAMCLAGLSLRDAGAETASAPGTSPETPETFAAGIHTALVQRDIGAMEKLVDWDGASPFKHRWVLFEIRKAFGRKLRSVTAEPFPKDGLASLAEFGPFKANMDVTMQVHVVFDEPATQYGASSDMVFLAARQGRDYRIALVNPIAPEPHQ